MFLCFSGGSAAEVGSTRSLVRPHQTHRSFVNSYETAPNARQIPQTERSSAGNSRPASRLDPQLEHKAPIGRPLPVNFVTCQLGRGGHLGRTPRLRDRKGRPKHATSPRSDPRGERASPCVPHFNSSRRSCGGESHQKRRHVARQRTAARYPRVSPLPSTGTPNRRLDRGP